LPHYIFLVKFTDEGIKNIKSIAADAKESFKEVEEFGGKLKDIYCLFGEYDAILIAELPSDEAAASLVLSPDPKGNFWYRSETMKAFTLDEFTDIVSKLP